VCREGARSGNQSQRNGSYCSLDARTTTPKRKANQKSGKGKNVHPKILDENLEELEGDSNLDEMEAASGASTATSKEKATAKSNKGKRVTPKVLDKDAENLEEVDNTVASLKRRPLKKSGNEKSDKVSKQPLGLKNFDSSCARFSSNFARVTP
jgi:hypothetical protein